MSTRETYQENKEFKEYVDRFAHNNPEYTLDEIFEHAIIKDMAEYYLKKAKGTPDRWNGARK